MDLDWVTISGVRDDHEVRLFTLSTCGHCKRVKNLMKEIGSSYKYVDVDLCSRQEKREITEFLRENDLPLSFPVVIIDDEIIIGNKEQEIIELLK